MPPFVVKSEVICGSPDEAKEDDGNLEGRLKLGLPVKTFFIFQYGAGEGGGFGGFSSLGRWKGGFCLAGSGGWGSRGSRDRGSNLRLGLQC